VSARGLVADTYTLAFLGLLGVYGIYSVWVKLDPRYPVAGGLALLVVSALVDAAGATATANTLATYVFYLLGAGVLLLLVDHGRAARRAAPSTPTAGVEPAAEGGNPADEGDGSAKDSLDHLEQQPVAVVDRPREDDREEEEPGHREPDHRE
jgi:hypothetical protein